MTFSHPPGRSDGQQKLALLLLALDPKAAFGTTSNPPYKVQGFFSAKGGTCQNGRMGSAGPLLAEKDWYDYLKFDGAKPTFDVLEKTKEYTSTAAYRSFVLKDIPAEYFADDYIFRGQIVGPFNRKDLITTNTALKIPEGFPDLDRQAFGFSIDPENPFRVLYFERWYATHTAEIKLDNGLKIPGPQVTGRRSVCAAFPLLVVWNPEGKIVYEALTTSVDRFEGNTNGKVAAFGLLETAGIKINNVPGDWPLMFLQKLGRFLGGPAQAFSKEEDVPNWWKSKAVGAEPND